MDHRARILDHLATHVESLAAETTAAVVAEVGGFGPVRDERLREEVLALARQGIGLLVEVMRRPEPPTADELGFVRERAIRRARQLVPLSALLHAYLIANRVVGRDIAAQSSGSAAAGRVALELTATAFEYTLVTTTVMADAYLETVQGDLADLERQRGELLDALLGGGGDATADLARRAAGLGLEPGRPHIAVVATSSAPSVDGATAPWRRVAEAVGRAAALPDRQPFVAVRGGEVVAVLRHGRADAVVAVLRRAAAALHDARGERLTAGIGPAFTDLTELRTSYDEARRALRHASTARPFVVGPDDVRLFDELTVSAGRTVSGLIPERMRSALEDPVLRASLEAFSAANLNVADAAQALFIHPNTLRYRLRRIAERTGLDPHVLADLLELTAAARVLAAQGRATSAAASVP
jgi:sugar diacid utilization regulator